MGNEDREREMCKRVEERDIGKVCGLLRERGSST